MISSLPAQLNGWQIPPDRDNLTPISAPRRGCAPHVKSESILSLFASAASRRPAPKITLPFAVMSPGLVPPCATVRTHTPCSINTSHSAVHSCVLCLLTAVDVGAEYRTLALDAIFRWRCVCCSGCYLRRKLFTVQGPLLFEELYRFFQEAWYEYTVSCPSHVVRSKAAQVLQANGEVSLSNDGQRWYSTGHPTRRADRTPHPQRWVQHLHEASCPGWLLSIQPMRPLATGQGSAAGTEMCRGRGTKNSLCPLHSATVHRHVAKDRAPWPWRGRRRTPSPLDTPPFYFCFQHTVIPHHHHHEPTPHARAGRRSSRSLILGPHHILLVGLVCTQ